MPQTAKEHGNEQAQENEPQVSGVDWEKAIAERDEKIAVLEQQVADAAKNAVNLPFECGRVRTRSLRARLLPAIAQRKLP